MESRQLRYFLAVAEHKGFTAAAAKIGVAQPALSAQIAKLEDLLGCRLFERHHSGVTLTEPGEHLRSEAVAILNLIQEAERQTRALGGTRKRNCTFGLPPYAAAILAGPLVSAVRSALPEINLTILDAMGGTIREWYGEGRLDIAMVYRIPNDPLADAVHVISEEFCVATAKNVLDGVSSSLDIDDVLRLPLVVSTQRNAHRQVLDQIAVLHGVKMRIAAEIDSVSGQRQLVLRGEGAAVLPLSGFDDWPMETLEMRLIRGDQMSAILQVICGRHVVNDPIIRSVERLATDLVRQLVTDGRWRGGSAPFPWQNEQSHALRL